MQRAEHRQDILPLEELPLAVQLLLGELRFGRPVLQLKD